MQIILLLFISLLSLRIRIAYERINQQEKVRIDVHFLLHHIMMEVQQPTKDQEKGLSQLLISGNSSISRAETDVEETRDIYIPQVEWQTVRRGWRIVKNFWPALRTAEKAFRRIIRCTKLSWHTRIGWEDAALTGISVGSLWAVKGLAYGTMAGRVQNHTRGPDFSVKPEFQRPIFHTEAVCICSVKVGDIIIAGMKVIPTFWQGVKKQWMTTRFKAL